MAGISSAEELEAFVRSQYELWNRGVWEDFIAAYKAAAPGGLVLEYVGRSVAPDGWRALDDMWARFSKAITIEVVAVIVNGQEAAAYVINKATGADGSVRDIPSVDLYHAKDGVLMCRYFNG